jgi:hypothetical protein
MQWMIEKPRRLIGCVFLAALPLALIKDLRSVVSEGRLSDPVMLQIDGLSPADAEHVCVYRVGVRGLGRIDPQPDSRIWKADRGWLTSLEIEAPDDVWRRVNGVTVDIGERAWNFNREEIFSGWKQAPHASGSEAARHGAEVRRLGSPPEVRAASSRIGRFQTYMNWSGDCATLQRLCQRAGWSAVSQIASLGTLAAIFLFPPRRLPRAVRRWRSGLRSAIHGPPNDEVAASAHAGLWTMAGIFAVVSAFAFLEWQSPYYFVQEDVLIGEFPAILVGCRGVWDGHWPEWNPYTGMGSPLMSEGMNSLTYPPLYASYAIARHVLDDEYATMEVFALLHMLAGYWLCKKVCEKIGCGQAAATLAGLSFALSGPILILGRSWHTFMPPVVWIPAIALSIEALRRDRIGWAWLTATSLSLAMPAHVGFPQLAVACFGMFCILVLSLAVTRAIHWTTALQGAAAVVVGIALSAPILLFQMEYGRHAHKVSTSRFSAAPGVAAMFLPSPLVSAEAPYWSNPPDFTHFYFFGGLLAWCWVAGGLLTTGGRFAAWRQGARLWWSMGLAFLLLALGDAVGLWNVVAMLPVISTVVRIPLRMMAFVAFGMVVSGSWLFSGLLRHFRQRPLAQTSLLTIAVSLLGYHLTRVDTAVVYRLFRPYPEFAGTPLEQLRSLDTTAARRACTFEDRMSTRATHGMSLADSMAGVYSIYSTEVYDPLAEHSSRYRQAVDRMSHDHCAALQAYGVRWMLIDRSDLRQHPDRAARMRVSEGWTADLEAIELPWLKIPLSELDDTLARFLGREPAHATPCESLELFEILASSPLVFRKNEPTVGLPFKAHTEGVDVDLAGVAGGSVVVNFLRLDWMTAAVDGDSIPCTADEWGRIVVNVPRGATQLAIRYQPPWVRGGAWGLGLAVAGIAAFCCAGRKDQNRNSGDPRQQPNRAGNLSFDGES